MAKLFALNPKRRRRARHRKNRARRRRTARVNPFATRRRRRRRHGRRRRNPFGLRRLLPSSGLVQKVMWGLVGFYGTKAADYLNKDWTYGLSDNQSTREMIKDAAAAGTAIAVSQGLRMIGLARGDAATLTTVGGLLYAINRGITSRGRAAITGDEYTFQKHLLTDYLMPDGASVFDEGYGSDLGHYGNQGAFLEDYVTVDDDGMDLEDYAEMEEF